MTRTEELEKRLKEINQRESDLSKEAKAIRDELRSIEFGVKIGDRVESRGKIGVVESFKFFPQVRWEKKDGSYGLRVSSLFRDFRKLPSESEGAPQ